MATFWVVAFLLSCLAQVLPRRWALACSSEYIYYTLYMTFLKVFFMNNLYTMKAPMRSLGASLDAEKCMLLWKCRVSARGVARAYHTDHVRERSLATKFWVLLAS